MIFERTKLEGAVVLELERRADERGFFARTLCRREFTEHELTADFVQANIAYSARRGTIRGLHYQVAPHQEVKLVRCVRGAIWDVIIDLRSESATYLEWFGVELTAESGRQLYIPKDFAHGYQTLVDDSEISYLVSAFYSSSAERGIRWDDPQFSIAWPETANPTISPKDRLWPDYEVLAGKAGRQPPIPSKEQR
jgi:dTDP-4-dehydrorhamnose 3,5-epimerase